MPDTLASRSYTTLILRIGLGLTILWFGVNQLMSPQDWVGWVPAWTAALGLAPETVVFLNGLFETIFAALLILGLWVRIAASLLFLHMILIIIDIGFNEIGVRDFGLAAALLALAWSGSGRQTSPAALASE